MLRKLTAPGRLYAVKLDEGEEVIEAVSRLIEAQGLDAAFILGIGGLSEAEVGFYSYSEGVYRTVSLKPPEGYVLEVASLTGNAVTVDGRPSIHLHVVIGVDPRTTVAGHLAKGIVKPLMELMIVEAITSPGGVLEAFSHRKNYQPVYKPFQPQR